MGNFFRSERCRLKAYYGEIVFSYTLKQAIQDKVLTPYNYQPRLVELTLQEAEEFIALSDEIARQFARDQGQAGGKPSIGLTALLMKRSRIVGSAVNKRPALEAALGGGVHKTTPYSTAATGV